MSNDHCGAKAACTGTQGWGGACAACQATKNSTGPCEAPCVPGRYECELPCAQDSDCRSEEGEICAVNPGEAETTGNATRCQKPCGNQSDCEYPAFGDILHTCLQVNGRKFCGQCLVDDHCPAGQRCQTNEYGAKRCIATGALSSNAFLTV